MNEILKKVKGILESEASLLVESTNDVVNLSKKDNASKKKIVDNRFELITKLLDSVKNKNEAFYTRLIEILAIYIERLYDRRVNYCNIAIVSSDEELDFVDTIHFGSWDTINFAHKNRKLAEQLFNYVCTLLENNENIKLDIETLKRLLNRNPKSLYFSIEENYVCRPFDFERLVIILKKNQTLEKSDIGIEDTYQLLLDTCELNNEKVFISLVKPEQYTKNHSKIDEILMRCNAKVFIEITNIIRHNFDKSFDRFSIVKKRNKNRFCETLIIEILHRHCNKEDYDLIHQILSFPEIELDYDMYYSDYTGQSDLKSIIALSENRTIIKDLMCKAQIQEYYSHGEDSIQLFILYAIIGEYEKAIADFNEKYEFKYDLYDEDKSWDTSGYAYGGWGYKDSLARFINKMCESFKEDETDYTTVINLINRIINSENIKYINLEETLTPIKEVLSPEDFKFLIEVLWKKYKSGNLNFLSISNHEDMFTQYKISIASEDEAKTQIENLNKKGKSKILIPPEKVEN